MSTTTLLEVGREAPDFRLRGPGGAFVTLSEYRGHKHVVLVFYPLAFSPTCSHQLPTIQAILPRLQTLGAEVLGISVDSHYANQAFAERLGLGFPLLSDFRRTASAAYGILLEDAGISGRAIFVVDRQGRIAHREVAPTPGELPDNARLLAALEALQA
jgi:peroxiredoxin (alkyl hydroperoxide reductase subunit C)